MTSLYSPEQGQTKCDAIKGNEENGHVEWYIRVTLAIRRVSRSPHGLRNDSARLADGIVERLSVDIEVRTSGLHGRTCDEEGVGPVLSDSRTKRPRVDAQKTSEVPRCALWAGHLGNVSVDEEIHICKISGVKRRKN